MRRIIHLVVTDVEPTTTPGHSVFSASDSFGAKVSVVTAVPPPIGSQVEVLWVPA